MTNQQKNALWFVILLSLLIVVSAVAWRSQTSGGGIGYFLSSVKPGTPPPYTKETADKLAKSKGFQFLVSYTNNGFEPTQITIKKGQTIRFTNNSKGSMHIVSPAQVGEAAYSTSDDCNDTSFNSCEDIASKDFWEFTFLQKGTWTYKNSEDSTKIGVVHVE